MFEAAPIDGANPRLPPATDLVYGGDPNEGGVRHCTDMAAVGMLKSGLPDIGVPDPDELRRLENSIRWLMNESGIRHLPRAATLPPVRGLPSIGAGTVEGAGSRALDPDHLFSPRLSPRSDGVARGVVKFLIASAIAAPAAYFIANSLQNFDTVTLPDASTMAPIEARLAALIPAPKRRSSEQAIPDGIGASPEADPIVMRGALPPTEPKPAEATDASVVEVPPAAPEPSPGDLAAQPPESAPGNAVAASNPPPSNAVPKPVPTLSARETAVLVERGRTLFEAGDLAAARLFFRRAANAGDASAALAMGATYDPEVLAKRFVRGIGANLEEARGWYEKARELGSPEGPRRLEMLAHR